MFVDTVRIKTTELEDKFLFYVFTAFRVALMHGKAAYCHVVSGVVRQIQLSLLGHRLYTAYRIYIAKVAVIRIRTIS